MAITLIKRKVKNIPTIWWMAHLWMPNHKFMQKCKIEAQLQTCAWMKERIYLFLEPQQLGSTQEVKIQRQNLKLTKLWFEITKGRMQYLDGRPRKKKKKKRASTNLHVSICSYHHPRQQIESMEANVNGSNQHSTFSSGDLCPTNPWNGTIYVIKF